ncbi:MAG: hypothetical protein JWQ19_3106 [Subtercola sp.]|nr:hypothetical protein [Subtercola sp.]
MRSGSVRLVLATIALGALLAIAPCLDARAAPPPTLPPTHALTQLTLAPGGLGSTGTASDPLTHTLYVAQGDSVLAVNELTGASTRFAETLGGHLNHVAVDPLLHEVFVTRADDYEGRWVVVFTESTLSTIATIPVDGTNIEAIAVDHRTHDVVAVGQGPGAYGRATFINEDTNAVRSSTDVGAEPDAVAVDEAAGVVYVANGAADTISIVDADSRSVTDTLPVHTSPIAIAVDAVSHRAFVSESLSESVATIASTRNPATGVITYSVIARVAVGGEPWGVGVDAETELVYVALADSASTVVLSENSDTVDEHLGPISSNPQQVAVDASVHTAFVASLNSATISVITPTLVLAPPHGCGFAWCV